MGPRFSFQEPPQYTRTAWTIQRDDKNVHYLRLVCKNHSDEGTGRKGGRGRGGGERKEEKKKRRRPGSPVEGLLVLFDLTAGQLMELRVNVDEFVLLFHLLPFLELLVDPLPPAKQITELSVRRHPDRFHFHSSNTLSSDFDLRLTIYRCCARRSIRRYTRRRLGKVLGKLGGMPKRLYSCQTGNGHGRGETIRPARRASVH